MNEVKGKHRDPSVALRDLRGNGSCSYREKHRNQTSRSSLAGPSSFTFGDLQIRRRSSFQTRPANFASLARFRFTSRGGLQRPAHRTLAFYGDPLRKPLGWLIGRGFSGYGRQKALKAICSGTAHHSICPSYAAVEP